MSFGTLLPLRCSVLLDKLCIFLVCRCKHLSAEWEELEEACRKRAAHLSKAVAREQVRGTERRTFFIGEGFCAERDPSPAAAGLL